MEELGPDGHPLNRLYVQRAQPKAERERMLKSQYAQEAAVKGKKPGAESFLSRFEPQNA